MDSVIYAVFAVFIFIVGSTIGSFLNVLAYRIPIKESIVKGRSHCTTCGKQILNRDLIPILSWIFLRGKCRFCGEKISPRYMIVELICGLSYLTAFLVLGISIKLAFAAVLFPVLIVLSLWDIDRKEIPYTCSIVIAVLGLLSFFVKDMPWYEHLIGMAVVAVPFAVLCFLGAMGGGDVQLMAAAGLLLGWSVVPAAMIGIILGALVGVVIKVKTKLNIICFGPFLSVGIACGLLWGGDIIEGYLSLVR
ncbi:MAG: prepilin peptidase [Ruminococcaceae bacterium]|nr:prepilin peptidase [Oscillospiraceae bacterium]